MLNVELKHKVVRNGTCFFSTFCFFLTHLIETVMSIIKNKREEAANAVVKNSVVFTVYVNMSCEYQKGDLF